MKPRHYRICTRWFSMVLLMLPAAVQRTFGEILEVPQIAAHAGPDRMEVLVRGRWGPHLGQFGKVDEASRPGPMDFAVTDDRLYVLDPVNARVQAFDLDGDFRREIPIGTRTADFMCVDAGGNVTVLDAFVRREFKTFSASGELLAHATLPASIGLCSAVFADGDRVWIEERHNRVFEVRAEQDKRGAPAQIVGALTGRPLGRNYSAVHARKKGTHEAIIRLATPEQTAERVTLRFPRPVASIVALESDDCGQVYLAAACPRAPRAERPGTDIVLVVIAPGGELAGSICMPDAYVTDHYRKLFVSRKGEVIQMQTTEDEVRFVRWTLPTQNDKGETR